MVFANLLFLKKIFRGWAAVGLVGEKHRNRGYARAGKEELARLTPHRRLSRGTARRQRPIPHARRRRIVRKVEREEADAG